MLEAMRTQALRRMAALQLAQLFARRDALGEQEEHKGMDGQRQIILRIQQQQAVKGVDHHSNDESPVEKLLRQNAEDHKKSRHQEREDEANGLPRGPRLYRQRIGDAGDAEAENKAQVAAED